MISIVLINWNGKRFLPDCLRSIAAQSQQPSEIFVIDNASTDGSQELLLREQHHYCYQLVCNERNLGYCGGANQGIRQTRGKYIVLLNPDVILDAMFLEQLFNIAEQHEHCGILTGNSCVLTGKPWTLPANSYEKFFSF